MTAKDELALDGVLAWFEKRGPVPGDTRQQKAACDYFAAGLIDSLAVVELISELEGRYFIRFKDSHFQERRFSTIGGVAEIIEELRAGQALT